MQAQQYHHQHVVALHHHHDSFPLTLNNPYPLHSDQYLAPTGGVDFTHNFLDGSSPVYNIPHEDSRYTLYRGQATPYRGLAAAAVAPTTIPPDRLGATLGPFNSESGNAMSPPASSLFPTEQLGGFVDPTWSWDQAQGSANGVVAPVPMPYASPEVSFLPVKSKEASPIVRTGGPPLPTPAAMAVLLNTRSGPSVYDSSAAAGDTTAAAMGTTTTTTVSTAREGGAAMAATRGAQGIQEGSTAREKKHACTMCHKRFDRPSTLRKHLLVHTGEKAFVCSICTRRFGVASNLNRHVKRCALKPVNMTSANAAAATATGGASSHKSGSDSASSDTTSPQTSPVATSPGANSIARSPPTQKRASISSSSCSSSPPRDGQQQQLRSVLAIGPKPAKRRRRAPSPSRWVPLSLVSFNLQSEDFYKSTQVPLPPVRPQPPREERNSWDENAPLPYHPEKGWCGRLPGPGFPPHQGLKPREVSKLNFGAGGTATAFTVGRLNLVF